MNKLLKFQLIMFTLLFIIIFSIGYLYQHKTVKNVQIKIEDKQRTTVGSSSKYIIFTKEESFEDTDSFFHQKYNSSDIYNQLKIGCDYKISVYGWRIPFFSSYRNIIKINEEKPCLQNQ